MKKILFALIFPLLAFSQQNPNDDSFVYEVTFEISFSPSIADDQKQLFTFVDGLKQSEYVTNVIVLKNETRDKIHFKILAFSDTWDNHIKVEDVPTMFTDHPKIFWTGNSSYEVRNNL